MRPGNRKTALHWQERRGEQKIEPGQHSDQGQGGDQPAGVGHVKVKVIYRSGNQGIESHRHGGEDQYHFEHQAVTEQMQTKKIGQGAAEYRDRDEFDGAYQN